MDLDQRLEFVKNSVSQIKTLPVSDIIDNKNITEEFIIALEALEKAVTFNITTLKTNK